ncbi:chorismate mutase [Candidatus Peregrinibacteria bacterium]|nr:chorismate mutase [Candidatus Peregrinibacteria bacterium]
MQKVTQELKKMRKRVESIDIQIIKLLRERFIFTNQIQTLKRVLFHALNQKKREKTLLKKYVALAKRYGLNMQLIKKLFQSIFSYSKKSGIIKRT